MVARLKTHQEQKQCGGGTWWETPDVCEDAAAMLEALISADPFECAARPQRSAPIANGCHVKASRRPTEGPSR